MPYVSREQLAEMVVASQLIGAPTPELIEVVRRIARGLVVRLRYSLDLDDAQQAGVVQLFRALPLLDTNLNCFAYLTSTVHNELKSMWNQEAKQQDLREQLAREQGWRPTSDGGFHE